MNNLIKKCIICGKPVFSKSSIYCLDCHHFEKRLHDNSTRRFSSKAIKAIWVYVRRYGYVCYYTGMRLEMKDPQSPWYCVFDHWLPNNPKKIVLTSALFNAMKSDLTEKEFWYYVEQLDNCRKKHLKVIKKPIIHWVRLYPARIMRHPQEAIKLPDDLIMERVPRVLKKKCCVCGRPVTIRYKSYPKYCPGCARIAYRMDREGFTSEATKGIWNNVRKYGYVCYYTGMRLDLKNHKSPWYCVFDHWIPHDPRKLVLTCALVNEMKLDLSEMEFWHMINELANFKKRGISVRKIKLKYWSRAAIIPIP